MSLQNRVPLRCDLLSCYVFLFVHLTVLNVSLRAMLVLYELVDDLVVLLCEIFGQVLALTFHKVACLLHGYWLYVFHLNLDALNLNLNLFSNLPLNQISYLFAANVIFNEYGLQLTGTTDA